MLDRVQRIMATATAPQTRIRYLLRRSFSSSALKGAELPGPWAGAAPPGPPFPPLAGPFSALGAVAFWPDGAAPLWSDMVIRVRPRSFAVWMYVLCRCRQPGKGW